MSQQGVSKSVRKATRWTRNGKGLFTVRDKESIEETIPPSHDEESQNNSSCRDVFGMPDWETPTGMPSTEMPSTEMPSIPQASTHRHRVPSKASGQENTPQARRQPRTSPKGKKLPVVIPYEDDYPRNFENMIIECNDSNSNSSFGDITYDESVFDEEYFRNRASQQHRSTGSHNRPNERRYNRHDEYAGRLSESSLRHEKLHPHHVETSNRFAENYIRTNDASPRPPKNVEKPTRSKSCDSMSGDIPISRIPLRSKSAEDMQPIDDVEMKERQLLDIALERSLRDSTPHGSDRKSTRHMNQSSHSARSRRSHASTQSPLAGSGCHLAMIAGQRSPRIRDRASDGDAPSFIWKREGKTWMKIPVQGKQTSSQSGIGAYSDHSGDRNYSKERYYPTTGNDEYPKSTSNAKDTPNGNAFGSRLAEIPQDRLEQMEQEMIEEALQLSIQTSSPSSPPAKVSPRGKRDNYYEPARLSRNDDAASIELLDVELSQSIQEKEMIELALERSLHEQSMSLSCTSSNSHLSEASPYSNRSNRSSDLPPRPEMNRMQKISPRRDTVECPKPMLGRYDSVRGGFNDRDDEDDELLYEPRNGDSAGTTSTGQRLVWKRGPNGRWGKYPENCGSASIPPRRNHSTSSGTHSYNSAGLSGRSSSAEDEEERMVQEALERSMQEAMRRSLLER